MADVNQLQAQITQLKARLLDQQDAAAEQASKSEAEANELRSVIIEVAKTIGYPVESGIVFRDLISRVAELVKPEETEQQPAADPA